MKNSSACVFAWALIFLIAPVNAQWMPTSGPLGVSVGKFLLHDGALYAGSDPLGVHKSTDSGKTWRTLLWTDRTNATGIPRNGVLSMAGMGRYVYVGTQDSLKRSGDGGKTWEQRHKGLETNWVGLLAAGQGVVYAGFWAGLYRSLDSGDTWSPMVIPGSNRQVAGIAVIDSFLYLGMDLYGMYRSSDSGKTWKHLAVDGTYGILSIHASKGVLWAGDEEGRVYRSKDDGKTWENSSTCRGNEVPSLAGTPSALFAACETGMMRSRDTGKTWKDISDIGLSHVSDRYAAVVVDGDVVFGGSTGGAIRFPIGFAGAEPPQINFGLGRRRITAVGSSGTRFYAGSTWMGSYGIDRGGHWHGHEVAGASLSAYLPFAGRTLAAGIGSIASGAAAGGIKAISDYDETPSAHAADSGLGGADVYALTRIANVLFAGTEKGVYRSMDTAKAWHPVIQGMEAIPTHVLIAAGTTLFAGSHTQGLFRSEDQGGSWTSLGAGLKNPVVALAFAGGVLVAAADSGREVFRSLDQGTTWVRAQSGLTASKVNALACSGIVMLAGTTQGVLKSIDGGESWHPFGEGMFSLSEGAAGVDDFDVTSLAIGSGYLVAGTARGTVWQRSVSDAALAMEKGPGRKRDPAARYRFDAASGNMVFENGPVGLKRKAVNAQGRRLPKTR